MRKQAIRYGMRGTEPAETDDEFVTGTLYPLKKWEWFDGLTD